MASTYAVNTGIELIADGEQSGTWGDTTNTNLQIVDRLTSGVGSIALSGTTHTLSTSDGALSEGQYKVLVFGGSPSGTNTVTVNPNDQSKQYFIVNNSGQSVIISQGSGSNVTVANGATDIIYCDGAGSGAAVTSFGTDLSGVLTSANNLSDLASAVTALTNLGLTATAAEINVLDGITADTAELNILDGVTATTAELNYNDITTLGTSEASKVVTADADGVVTFDNGITEEFTAVTSTSNATTVNSHDGTTFSHTLTENTTFTFSNPAASGKASGFTLKIVQDASASGYTVTWPSSVDWPSGTAPTLTGTANAVDQFVFYTHDGGTTWYGFVAGQDLG
ncbi:hypothetical protein N8470_00480 [bacterium]|nr:hypothetical protein [bacterium]